MRFRLAAIAMLMAGGGAAQAQLRGTPEDLAKAFSFTRIAAVAEPTAIPLYANATGSASTEVWDIMGNGQRVVRNITRPTLTPFLPARGKATGAAVLVAPGGAFAMLSMDNEGWPVAKWLADHGVAAFVLKYRLLPTPPDERAFSAQTAKIVASAMNSKSGPPDIQDPPATQDALAALKMIRSNSSKWGIDPKRVGMIGFSAGAMTSLRVVLEGADGARPDFFGFIYGPMQPVTVPVGAPPMFAALAMDDPLFGGHGFGIIDSWHQAGRPVELHAYERGSHGFGMGAPGTTTTMLLPEFYAWLQSRGTLSNGGAR